jgi:hypothetical protein
MDVFPLEVQDDNSIKVSTGLTVAEKGGPENPSKTVPYNA